MKCGETHCELDRKYLYCLLLFHLGGEGERKEQNSNEIFLKPKLYFIKYNFIRRFSFQKRLSSGVETDHVQVSFPKDLELTLFLLFFSLLLSLNSFSLRHISTDWTDREVINKILLIKAIIKDIF